MYTIRLKEHTLNMVQKEYTKSLCDKYKVNFFILFFFISISCKSQVNIFTDTLKIESTHVIKNNYIDRVLNFLGKEKEFENWGKSSKRVLIISSLKRKNDTLVRVFPIFRETFALPLLDNNYKEYLMYKDIFIIFWGDENLFFKKNKNVVKENIFDNSILKKVKNGDYYGCEFVIKNKKLILLEKNYLPEPLLGF